MKSLKLAVMVLVVSFSLLVNLSWGAGYYFGPTGDDLVGIDTKESINDGNIEMVVIIYLTQQDLDLAKEFLKECLKELPKKHPFRAELRETLRQLKNLKTTPDIELVLALAMAQADSSKVIMDLKDVNKLEERWKE